jgi:hypothetical protein
MNQTQHTTLQAKIGKKKKESESAMSGRLALISFTVKYKAAQQSSLSKEEELTVWREAARRPIVRCLELRVLKLF